MNLESCNCNDVITYLLQQQLFKEPYFLTDRTAKKQLKITASSEVISKMQEKLLEVTEDWELNNEEKFLQSLAKLLNVDFEHVYSIYKIKAEALPNDEESECLKFMFALSESIHLFHEKAIQKAHKKILNKFDFGEERLNTLLGILSQNADYDLSLFQNFYILKQYSAIVGVKIESVVIAKTFSKIVKKVEKLDKQMK